MATKKDLVEAQSFAKRRLTTAFVAGAPGGREVEPHQPLKAIIGGLFLSVVLVVASLAFGWIKGTLPTDWGDNRLVIGKTSGARFVAIKDVLHPVINTTSARLLIPAKSFQVITVDDPKLNTKKRGATIGILGAPDSLTPPADLMNSGWTACVGTGEAVGVGVGRSVAHESADGQAIVVTSAGQTWVVSGTIRYPISAPQVSAVTLALALDRETPRPVPATWLNLFTLGPALQPVEIAGLGKPIPGLPPGASLGSVLAVGGSAERRYLVNATGDLEPLPAVAHAMYRLGSGSGAADLTVQPSQISSLQVVKQQLTPPAWPAEVPTPLTGAPCATLTSVAGQQPSTTLSTSTTVKAPGSGLRALVDSNSGALVRSVGAGTTTAGQVFAIDPTATAYAIPSASPEILGRLGYSVKNVAPVPAAWLELFRPGPALDPAAAQTVISAGSG
jgi:type VII secretion protein EccB